MPRNWLLAGDENGRALHAVNKLYVMHNWRDPALKRYRCLVRDGRGKGLGYSGIRYRKRLGKYANRYEQINVANVLGITHSWNSYVKSKTLMDKTREVALHY